MVGQVWARKGSAYLLGDQIRNRMERPMWETDSLCRKAGVKRQYHRLFWAANQPSELRAAATPPRNRRKMIASEPKAPDLTYPNQS